jgi:dTDP-glucose 4,6-dehydratase
VNTIAVTGGCGFIGSAFILKTIADTDCRIVNVDCLSYAGNPENLVSLRDSDRYVHIAANIGDAAAVADVLDRFQPDAIINFAAETHVDRSISSPRPFLETNVMGTFVLIEATRVWWATLNADRKSQFRFLHVSTDEVYGSLGLDDPPFTEATAYSPNSPYAASKAASDHLVRAYGSTYGLPVLITNCSNNYGPRQFPEKLIPFMIVRMLDGATLPIYGDGENVRDWLFVDDHCSAIWHVLNRARIGETYNIGGGVELSNKNLVGTLCGILDELRPRADGVSFRSQIEYVRDRPGHDRRYAIDSGKLATELGWRAQGDLLTCLRQTVNWYLENPGWIARVTSGEYRNWVQQNYIQERGQ